MFTIMIVDKFWQFGYLPISLFFFFSLKYFATFRRVARIVQRIPIKPLTTQFAS